MEIVSHSVRFQREGVKFIGFQAGGNDNVLDMQLKFMDLQLKFKDIHLFLEHLQAIVQDIQHILKPFPAKLKDICVFPVHFKAIMFNIVLFPFILEVFV